MIVDGPREPDGAPASWLRHLARLQKLELRASTMFLLSVPLTAAVSYAEYRLGREEWYAGAFSLAPTIVLVALLFASGEFVMSCWRQRPQAQLIAEVVLCLAVIGWVA